MKDWVEIAGNTCESFDLPKDIDLFLSKYKTYDLVIPVLHGRYGEDGVITGMCETLGLRVAYSPSHVHALCMDKYWTNTIVESIWVRIPKSWIPWLPPPPKLLPSEKSENLDVILIVKPNKWWSSLATTRATTFQEFQIGIEAVDSVITSLTAERVKLLEWSSEWEFVRRFPPLRDMPIVQEYIPGKEYTVGVYRDSSGTHVLPIIETISLKWEFFDYEEKYAPTGDNEIFSDIDTSLRSELESTSSKIYDFLGCRGVVRMDYRYDGKNIYFLEVNTIPGFTSGSLVPKMWKKAWKTEKEFVEMLSYS
jgi:D-alanine-D-alanine ligase